MKKYENSYVNNFRHKIMTREKEREESSHTHQPCAKDDHVHH